jgi:hypothetical protein
MVKKVNACPLPDGVEANRNGKESKPAENRNEASALAPGRRPGEVPPDLIRT